MGFLLYYKPYKNSKIFSVKECRDERNFDEDFIKKM